MSPPVAAAAELHDGVNDPSPIARAVVLDYYDGPVAGVLETGNGSAYRFAMLDKRQLQANDSDDNRVYGLYPLPPDGFTRVAEAISAHVPPRWPVWCPVWQFQSDETRQAVEFSIDDVLGRAGPLAWVVVGNIGAAGIRALPVRMARAS